MDQGQWALQSPGQSSYGLEKPAVSWGRVGAGWAQGPPPAAAHLSKCACSCGEHSPYGRSSRSHPGDCGSGARRWGPLLGAPGTRRCLGEGPAGSQRGRREDIAEA